MNRLLKIKSKNGLYVTLLCCFLLYGIGLTIFGATLPQIIRAYNWNYTMAGILLASGAAGYFITSFFCGFLIGKFGLKKVLIAGLLLNASAFFLFARVPWAPVNYILSLFIGTGNAMSEVVINYIIMSSFGKGRSARGINLLHAFFCIGAIIAPLVTGLAGKYNIDWKILYYYTGVIFLLPVIAVSVFSFSWIKSESPRVKKQGDLLLQPLIIIFSLILFLYVGVELGTSNWVSEYFVSVMKSDISTGAFMVSVFWSGILTGRMAISIFFHKYPAQKILLALTAVSGISILCNTLSFNIVLSGMMVYMTGLGFSGVYPQVMLLSGKIFKTPSAVGIVATGGGIGSLVFPFLVSFLGDYTGLRGGFIFLFAVNVIMMILCAFILKNRQIESSG